MGKLKGLVILLAGGALAFGAQKVIPPTYNSLRHFLHAPTIPGTRLNNVLVFDHDSKSMKGYFESEGSVIEVDSNVKNAMRSFALEIPQAVREKGVFTFYAQDPEGNRTEQKKFYKNVKWGEEAE